MILWLALAIGLFFAVNIGASGTAAAFGAAYGSGAIHRRPALLLCAAFALAGSVLAGQQVATTLGKGLLPAGALPLSCAATILGAACVTLFLANLLGIPLSTSEVTVGAVVGAAMVLGQPPWGRILFIVATWVLIPFLSFVLAYLLQRTLVRLLRPYLREKRRAMSFILTLGGCYEAFAAGANNVANAVGPLIGAGVIAMNAGVAFGGLAVALGALALGGRVLNTNAKKITTLDLPSGAVVSFTGATLVVIASLMGLPTPLTQVTTVGIIGVGYANGGIAALNPVTLRRLAAVWLVSPVLSLAISYLGTAYLTGVATPPLHTTVTVVAAALAVTAVGRLLLRPARSGAQPAAGAEAQAEPALVVEDTAP
ncbi:MAG TPA: inorganic phosphate transporter [Symbiobacteriaceae bacterium]|nr:inorganic phosphate transporter [Symbiobacteriaceae bacterium]